MNRQVTFIILLLMLCACIGAVAVQDNQPGTYQLTVLSGQRGFTPILRMDTRTGELQVGTVYFKRPDHAYVTIIWRKEGEPGGVQK